MTEARSPSISPSRRRVEISPERQGSTTFKNLSYTPEKLESSYMYKEVTINKKVETEKNKIRQLESLNALLEDNIKHLSFENQMMKQGYQKQIDMYKRMLREQEEETKKLIKNLQLEYTLQIEKILLTHEQDSKVAQAEKEQLEGRIEQLLFRIHQLEGQVNHNTNKINDLTSDMKLTSQKLLNTEDKLFQSQALNKQTIDRLNRQINNLNNQIIQNTTTFNQELDALSNTKNRQIDNLKRLHLTQLDRLQAKRDVEMKAKNLQMNDIKATFDRETQRLEDIINNKDRVNEALALELRKQKETIVVLSRNYDLEIGKLVNEKDHILSDLAAINDERNFMDKELSDMGVLFNAERGRNAVVVNSLQGQIQMKNIQLAKQNQRLLRAISQYQKQLSLISHNVSSVNKSLQFQRSQQIRRLMLQIRNLKQVLLQSSRQMDRCKQQFLRLQLQKDQLIRINMECEAEAIRLKSFISEQDYQLRLRRM